MNPRIADLVETIKHLEAELENELARRRVELAYTLHGRAVRFEQHVLARHGELRTRLSRYILGARPLRMLTAPLTWFSIVATWPT